MECMKGGPFDIGFVDPNRVHEEVVRTRPGQTEDYLLKSLLRQQTKREILLPYNFSFHFILLVIQPDSGKVLVMDSLRKEKEIWADFREMLQR
jgi:hypothetical protein